MSFSESKKRKLSFFSIFFTFVLDNLGWAFVIPIFAPLFLKIDHFPSLTAYSFGTKTIILGVFLGAFPLAQFIGAPLLGEYGDNKGRKKSLLFSILLTTIGYGLSAYGIIEKNLTILFISRILSGLFAGNLSICLAALADLSTGERQKTKNFGYLSILAGGSIIIGAFLGGKLSDSTINPLFNPAFPFFIATVLSFLNLLFIIFTFYETANSKRKSSYHFFKSFNNIKHAFKIKKLKYYFLIYFFFIFSWSMLFQFSPVLVVKRFGFGFSAIGDVAAFMGVCWAIGSIITSRFLARFSSIKILEITLLFMIIPLALVGFFHHITIVILLISLASILGGISWPACNAIISERTTEGMQGKTLGISQSMQSLAISLAPIIGGYIGNFSIMYPFILASISGIIGIAIYIKEKD